MPQIETRLELQPIEIVSLYVRFWFVRTEDRAQVLNGKFQETGGAYMTAGFYENLILKAVIQKFEQKFSKFRKKKTKGTSVSVVRIERVKTMIFLCANLAVD